MNAPAPDVTVIIVSFRTRDLLARCLQSLPPAAGRLALQVVVVDNDSRDGTLEMLRERFPSVVAMDAGGNLGFARSMNLGIARATGRVWVWLNPDCEMPPGSLATLVGELEAHPDLGILAPRLVYPDGRPQPSAQAFPSALRMFVHFLGVSRWLGGALRHPLLRGLLSRGGSEVRSYAESAAGADGARDVDWVSGACFATPADFARKVGPLDEGYFMYCEDADWCHRVHALGRRVRFHPDVVVVHHVGASGPSNPFVLYHHYHSLLRYFRRYRAGQYGVIRTLCWVAFALRGLAAEAGRLLGGARPHPWWRLAGECWSEVN